MEERVILVDSRDNPLGTAPKLLAHQQGSLHRAISVFVYNDAGEMLLQRRAAGKYHSPGLWSNACCSHPRPDESTLQAAGRRLREEMGMTCALQHRLTFEYRADVGAGLTEHEMDHVFVGVTDAEPVPDPAEVQAWRWVAAAELDDELRSNPDSFTAWFPLALAELERHS